MIKPTSTKKKCESCGSRSAIGRRKGQKIAFSIFVPRPLFSDPLPSVLPPPRPCAAPCSVARSPTHPVKAEPAHTHSFCGAYGSEKAASRSSTLSSPCRPPSPLPFRPAPPPSLPPLHSPPYPFYFCFAELTSLARRRGEHGSFFGFAPLFFLAVGPCGASNGRIAPFRHTCAISPFGTCPIFGCHFSNFWKRVWHSAPKFSYFCAAPATALLAAPPAVLCLALLPSVTLKY